MNDYSRFDRDKFINNMDLIQAIEDDVNSLIQIKQKYFEDRFDSSSGINSLIVSLRNQRKEALGELCQEISHFFTRMSFDNRLALIMHHEVLPVAPDDKSSIEKALERQKSYSDTLEFIKHSDPMVFTHQYITRTFEKKFDFSNRSNFLGLYKKYPNDDEIRDKVIDELISTVSQYMHNQYEFISEIMNRYYYVDVFNFKRADLVKLGDDELKLVFDLAEAVKKMTEIKEE